MSNRIDEPSGGGTPANWHRDIVTAMRFLTRIPIGRESEARSELAAAAWAFPFVGALLGGIGGAAFAAALAIGLPSLAAALIALGTITLVTGALHEDGLADTADGLGGGSTPEKRLTIMRDSRIGAFGTLALIFTILLKASALAGFVDARTAAMVLIAAASLSRGVLPWLMVKLPLASKTGVAAASGTPSRRTAAVAAIVGSILALVCLGPTLGLLATALAVLAAWVGAQLARRFLGGYNGDLLGAVQQVAEFMVLLGIVAVV
jgi:adenosylcobinamide-GDP ribazoletransferase